jgi:hypothetical protein
MSEVPDRSVAAVITVNDMYHELQGLRGDVSRVETKLDTMPLQIAQLTTDVSDHETRLRSIEQTRTVTWGQLAAVCTLLIMSFGVIATIIATKVH